MMSVIFAWKGEHFSMRALMDATSRKTSRNQHLSIEGWLGGREDVVSLKVRRRAPRSPVIVEAVFGDGQHRVIKIDNRGRAHLGDANEVHRDRRRRDNRGAAVGNNPCALKLVER